MVPKHRRRRMTRPPRWRHRAVRVDGPSDRGEDGLAAGLSRGGDVTTTTTTTTITTAGAGWLRASARNGGGIGKIGATQVRRAILERKRTRHFRRCGLGHFRLGFTHRLTTRLGNIAPRRRHGRIATNVVRGDGALSLALGLSRRGRHAIHPVEDAVIVVTATHPRAVGTVPTEQSSTSPQQEEDGKDRQHNESENDTQDGRDPVSQAIVVDNGRRRVRSG